MANKRKSKMPGLIRIGNIWHIDKQIKGQRICASTGESDYKKAERIALARITEIKNRSKKIFHISFEQAAMHYLETEAKRSLQRDARALQNWTPMIGDMQLEHIHMNSLRPFINQRLQQVRSSTVMRELAVIRRILSLAARVWRNADNKPWLETMPLISFKTLQQKRDKRKAYPLSWAEQQALFSHLPIWLAQALLFKVNTGTREQEVCGLRWQYQVDNQNLFVIPGELVKNGQDRLVVLNSVAKSIVDACRGQHPDYVFTQQGERIKRLNVRAWQNAWREAGLPQDDKFYHGVHNLKHTFGMRLRHAGVPLETRKVLLGHSNGDITTHYSAVQLNELIEAAEKVLQVDTLSRKIPEQKTQKIIVLRK